MAKWNLSPQTQAKQGESSEVLRVVVDIPALASLRALGSEQSFDIGFSRDGGATFDTREARLIGDGQSLLWGDRIIRLPASVTQMRKSGQLRFGSGPYANRIHLEVQPDRAVKVKERSGAPSGGAVKAPMTGKVVQVLVAVGQHVAEGDALLTIEAMKMENRILADWAGVVKSVNASPGRMAALGDELLKIEPSQG